MNLSVSISEFREKIKDYLEEIAAGKSILLTKRGKVIAKVVPELSAEEQEELAYQQRLESYSKGGIEILDDIVHSPLKQYDDLDTDIYNKTSIAAEPDAE